MSKKNKIFTLQDWYDQPKSFTNVTYSRFIRKMVDPYSWGRGKGHYYKTETINKALCGSVSFKSKTTGQTITRSAKSNVASTEWLYRNHIDADSPDRMFYVMSPTSNISMAGLDLDCKKDGTTTQDDINSAVACIQSIIPCYAEVSTSGFGRHLYPIIDFTPYANSCPRYYSDDNHKCFSYYCNRLLLKDQCSLSKVLKHYINNRFNVYLDGIKGYYATYKWIKPLDHYYLERVNAAQLLKCPHPNTSDEFFTFLSSPVYSVSSIQSIISGLLSEMNYQLPDIDDSELLADYPTPLTKAHSHSVVASSQDGGSNESKVESSFLPPSSSTIILSGNRQYSAKNRDWYEAGQWVFRQYIMVEKRQPTKQEVKEALEQIGIVDDTKLDRLYKCISNRFDPDKIHLGKYLERDTKRYEAIDIFDCLNGYGKSYRRLNIIPEQLAVGMDYFRTTIECSKNTGKELTVSTDAMGAHSLKLWKQGLIKRPVKWSDPKKSRAIRYMLEQFRDIDKVNGNYTVGISMRWMVGEQYHVYNEVSGKVGKTTESIERARGLASLQNWDEMDNVG